MGVRDRALPRNSWLAMPSGAASYKRGPWESASRSCPHLWTCMHSFCPSVSLSHAHLPLPTPKPWPRVSLVVYTHLFFEAASHVAPSVLIVITYTCALWTSGPLAAIFKWWGSGIHHQSQCPAVLGTKPRAPCMLRTHSTEHHCQPLCAVLTTIECMMAYWVLCLLIWEAILKQWTVSGIYFRWPHSAPYI